MKESTDIDNRPFALALDLIRYTDRNFFLTGKAGTGKTTFLKYLHDHRPKNMVITAPTGVAAINAGGVTLHSLFQLPLAPFIPVSRGGGFTPRGQQPETVNRHSLLSRLRFNRDKKNLLQELELLVIDEISMVRADLLDAVDTVLRHVRNRHQEPFGGVQVLMIGDLFQLPPVLKESDRALLSEFYPGPYFFDSQVMREYPAPVVEFEKIYRQRDAGFIRLLHQVRNNELDEEGRALLESRFQPGYGRRKDEKAILLCTHNEQARRINQERLNELPDPMGRYEAEVEQDFPENAYPAEPELLLKKNARVMFIRNDSAENGRRFFNGKLGVVTGLEEEAIRVLCDGEEEEIIVKRETWENIRYTLDPATRSLQEEVMGKFSQFPLRLAWAITIHKSQGLTFDEVIIDAGEAFAPGQVYVALSRCTTLEGLTLRSRVRPGSLGADPRILEFTRQKSRQAPLEEILENSRGGFEQKILQEQFDLARPLKTFRELMELLQEEHAHFTGEAVEWTGSRQEELIKLQDTGEKFRRWWQGLLKPGLRPGDLPELVERTGKAALHFRGALQHLVQGIRQCPLVTEHWQSAKAVNEYLQEIGDILNRQCHVLEGYENGWLDAEAWLQRRRAPLSAAMRVNVYATQREQMSESPHPQLFQLLKKCRDAICARKQLPVYLVANQQTLNEMARCLPQTETELLQIKGMGPAKVEKFGEEFLGIIRDYAAERGLASQMSLTGSEKTTRAAKAGRSKGATYSETLNLYREGKSIAEIAALRKLANGTIEGHLARLVEAGELNVEDLIEAGRLQTIRNALKEHEGTSILPLKERLGEEVSYGEIRMVMAAEKRTQSISNP